MAEPLGFITIKTTSPRFDCRVIDLSSYRKSGNATIDAANCQDVMSSDTCLPPFFKLPLSRYYYSPHCTWCFVGEIIDDTLANDSFCRHRVLVKDKYNVQNLTIFFYPESGTFDYNTLKLGHTIAVMFAEQYCFRDMSIGLRIEHLNFIKVIPCNLEAMAAISSQLGCCAPNRCWGCDIVQSEELKKCGACKVARYCDKKCQVNDWRKRHKRWCKALPDMVHLASLDYNEFKPTESCWR
jgi:hypothetical protein